jgi:hypothetical protein
LPGQGRRRRQGHSPGDGAGASLPRSAASAPPRSGGAVFTPSPPHPSPQEPTPQIAERRAAARRFGQTVVA